MLHTQPSFILDSNARKHSEQLLKLIQSEINASSGKIPFARYMELALYAPGLGYYSAGSQKIGKEGDFITAPEISPLFSRCLAKQCQPILSTLESGDILELGAGTGTMAAEILTSLSGQGCLPERYLILETSADLRDRQYKTLQTLAPSFLSHVHWLDRLPTSFRGVILANEVMDAMPVHRFRIDKDHIQEFYVCWKDNALSECLDIPSTIDLTDAISKALPLPLDDYESEINSLLPAWINSLGHLLSAGMILLIDYGFPRHEYYHADRNRGTLMCHYQHRMHTNPFILPGLQDITAHVDFTAVAESAVTAGLSVAGYTTQAAFLLSLGITHMAALEVAHPEQQLQLNQQLKLLTLPSEMGELFKVIALTKNLEVPLEGFVLQDRRSRL